MVRSNEKQTILHNIDAKNALDWSFEDIFEHCKSL